MENKFDDTITSINKKLDKIYGDLLIWKLIFQITIQLQKIMEDI